MRRVFAVLSLSVFAATVACSGSGNLIGPASDTGSQASLADGQDPVSNHGVTVILQGQDPLSHNGSTPLSGQEHASGNAQTQSASGQEPSSSN
jgi:hypothetical protein